MSLLDRVSHYAADAAGHVAALFTSPGSFLSPAPLAMALVLGGLIVFGRLRRSRKSVTLRAFLGALFPARVWRNKSARHDFAIIVINNGLLFFLPAIGALIVFPLTDQITALTERHREAGGASSVPTILAFSLFVGLVWDFANTFSHYLKHKIPFLWEFHKVHHCAPVLTPLTALRRHPVEVLAGAMISTTVSAVAILAWIALFGVPGGSMEIGGAIALVYFWRLLGYNLRHSHVWISYGPFWNRYLISPAHHQLHHSRDPRHHDCNFGHIFTFWDRMFGTHYTPVEGEAFELGIEREENEKLATLRALYLRPIAQAALRFAPDRAKDANGAAAAE